MSDYPPRVEKSENIYELWESGEGDMDELAIGLYDLTAQYKALYDDYVQLEAEIVRLQQIEMWTRAFITNQPAYITGLLKQLGYEEVGD